MLTGDRYGVDDTFVDVDPTERRDAGHLDAAIMPDGRGGVVVEFSGDGTARIRIERTPGSSDAFGAIGVPLSPLREVPVNAGADRATTIGRWEPEQPEPTSDVECPSHAETKELMAAQRDQSRVNEHGQSVPRGGGRGGAGKKPRSRSKDRSRVAFGAADEQVPSRISAGTPRWRVTGLSLGEWSFYDRRPGEALEVLRSHAGRIVTDDSYEPATSPTPVSGRSSISVYGLRDYEIDALRLCPGSARVALSQHARSVAGPFVEKLDGAEEMRRADRTERRKGAA